jgi:uracil-DNA glycosylase
MPRASIPADHPAARALELDGLESAHELVDGCRACDLWARATQGVFGEGSPRAPLMLVGEQPGDREDLAGRPFVGPAGASSTKRLTRRASIESTSS